VRVRIALAAALVAVIAATASVTATQPTPTARYAGDFKPLTLPVARGVPDALLEGPAAAADPASPPPPAVLRDPGTPALPRLARRLQPSAEPGVLVKQIPKPRTSHALRGAASWYCNSDASRGPISSCHYAYPDTSAFNAYAAAGPRLRAALGNWRGRIVYVDGVRVKLVDWCECYQGQSNEKLIDLYLDVYRRVGGSVTVRW
jgi:hypothetical protein